MPKNDKIWPEIGIFGHFGPGLAASFGALSVGWLVVVARGCISQATYLLYTILFSSFDSFKNMYNALILLLVMKFINLTLEVSNSFIRVKTLGSVSFT